MHYISSKKFDKQFAKLSKKIREQCIERMEIFVEDPFDPILHNHAVHHPYDGCRSINVSGDIRAIYQLGNDGIACFIAIGSHSELYK